MGQLDCGAKTQTKLLHLGPFYLQGLLCPRGDPLAGQRSLSWDGVSVCGALGLAQEGGRRTPLEAAEIQRASAARLLGCSENFCSNAKHILGLERLERIRLVLRVAGRVKPS